MKARIRQLWKRDAQGSCATILLVGVLAGGSAVSYSTARSALSPTLRIDPEERLVAVWRSSRSDPNTGHAWLSYPDLADLRSRARSLELLSAWRTEFVVARTPAPDPVRLEAVQIESSWFELVHPEMLIGRALQKPDDAPGAQPVVVLSEATWRDHFSENREILGSSIQLGDVSYTIVGVLSTSFATPVEGDVWIPLGTPPDSRGQHRMRVIGRLRDGIPIDAAAREVRAVGDALIQSHPREAEGRSLHAEPLARSMAGQPPRAALVLASETAIALILGCVLLMQLRAVRLRRRRHDLAIQRVLGAGGIRLLCDHLLDAVTIALAAVPVATATLFIGAGLARALFPPQWAALELPRADFHMLMLALSLTLFILLSAAVVEALNTVRMRTFSAYVTGTRSTVPRGALPGVLLSAQTAISCLLLSMSAMLALHARSVLRADFGFEPDSILTTVIDLPMPAFRDAALRARTIAQLTESLGPVAATMTEPVSETWNDEVQLSPGETLEVAFQVITQGYETVLGLTLIAGRGFTRNDRAGTPGVVLVNETFVRMHLSGRPVLGTRVRHSAIAEGFPGEFEIVGILPDHGPDRATGTQQPAAYFAHGQVPIGRMSLLSRSSIPRQTLREVLRTVGVVPIENMQLLTHSLRDDRRPPLMNLAEVGGFAVLMLLLSIGGIAAVTAGHLRERAREFAIRACIGATPITLRLLIARTVCLPVGLALVMALAARMPAERVLSWVANLPLEISIELLVGCGVLLVLVCVAASWPAIWRAGHLQSGALLRYIE